MSVNKWATIAQYQDVQTYMADRVGLACYRCRVAASFVMGFVCPWEVCGLGTVSQDYLMHEFDEMNSYGPLKPSCVCGSTMIGWCLISPHSLYWTAVFHVGNPPTSFPSWNVKAHWSTFAFHLLFANRLRVPTSHAMLAYGWLVLFQVFLNKWCKTEPNQNFPKFLLVFSLCSFSTPFAINGSLSSCRVHLAWMVFGGWDVRIIHYPRWYSSRMSCAWSNFLGLP